MYLNKEQANRVYDILVEICDAPERLRSDFVYHSGDATQRYTQEYRFCGKLGFGGKLWSARNRIYVSYYRETETPERNAIVEKVNEILAEVCKEILEEQKK